MSIKLLLGMMLLLSSSTSTAQLRTHIILPSLTDRAIATYTSTGDEHYVYLDDSVKN